MNEHLNTNSSLDALINSGFLNQDLIEEQYALYKQNPSQVDPSWRPVFASLENEKFNDSISQAPFPQQNESSALYQPYVAVASTSPDYRIAHLVEAYRTFGHLAAKTNPLDSNSSSTEEIEQLRLENFGFTKNDLSNSFPSHGFTKNPTAPLNEILNELKATYSGCIGVEYMGLHSPDLEFWLQRQIEHKDYTATLSVEQKQTILQHLNKSELFESFIHTKYVGQKRFSLEGSETLIPMLAAMIDTGAGLGIEEYYIGMSHRGRLNVLANIFDKSYSDIFSEFEEGYVPASVEGSGDVKYHKGFYSQIKSIHGHNVSLTLTPNPSHLESVDPVVEGQTYSRQVLRGDDVTKDKIAPILIHGDAAISGQGIVYETMQLCNLDGYATGGTIHFIINNQIGFTTIPRDSRSTTYCSDIAKIFRAPIFHVNAEDPEDCVFVTNLAIEMRQRFHCDVFIELVCYRKYGHNETDEPAFTQPIKYKIIRDKKPIREIYRDALIRQGILNKDVIAAMETEFKSSLQQAMNTKNSVVKIHSDTDELSASEKNEELFQRVETGVPKDILKEIGTRLCQVPEGFVLHPKLAVLLRERLAMVKDVDSKHSIDWGMGELLAYGSLLWNGTSVRLSGQDSCRGTFSHRHALLVNQANEQGYIPLKNLKQGQGRFDVYNSPLSEYSVLGFEFGYSIAAPEALVLWEAQFGDFSNCAQVIIDQYIATSEQKWSQKTSLTLLLPHGYEGQGPEHSSARIERFLSLAGDSNMLIVNPTTPAQFFHLLRRQILRPLRKPLIVFTPKGLLRHPACVSRLEEFTKGTFQEIIDDPNPPKRTKRLMLCSGRIYYNLIEERERLAVDDASIVRIEQLYPLNVERLKEIIGRCSTLKECVWVQEEPSNMGAWNFIRQILRDLLPKSVELTYVGRMRSASPAAGSHAAHKREHAAILSSLFGTKDPLMYDTYGNLKA